MSVCRQTGALIGHGFLRGYAERGSGRVVHGRHLFCSDRHLRPGCGRTFSVTLMTVILGFVVRTLTLLGFAQAVLRGLSRRAAWLVEAGGALSLSSGYRLWQPRVRRAERAPSLALGGGASTGVPEREPLAQPLSHFTAVLGDREPDLFAAFQ